MSNKKGLCKKGNATQQRIYNYICAYLDMHGYVPSTREIGIATNIKSTATVHYYLQNLMAAGLISSSADGQARAYRVNAAKIVWDDDEEDEL